MNTTTLAIDYGARRVGIAVSDPMGCIAIGLDTIDNGPDLLARICALVRERGVGRIVIGLPLTLKGEVGDTATLVLAFAETLRAAVDVPVETLDERFTSSIATQTMKDLGLGKKKRREKGRVDEIAAILLLQDYLAMHP
ncbi:MAG: Holliday junction resolvase RuvX [Ignavibacteria bacterium]|nr:Holliday junction resolvase RuvX [Ignavibacteria bacterium]